ncbi:MAG: hypothetical protein J2P46_00365 [Zavarzinella sp.]|nr:hypothetical protein [Zavarzinella sp.]
MSDGPDPRSDPDGDWPPRRDDYDVRDDYDDEFGYADPRRKVHGPGVALMVVGWVGVLVSLGIAVVGAVLFFAAARRPPRDLSLGAVMVVAGFASAAACVVTAVAGTRMRHCRNWGLALTAAILAICSFLLLGLCSVLTMPFGIWALVVLVQPDVKREFEQVALGRSRPARAAWNDKP